MKKTCSYCLRYEVPIPTGFLSKIRNFLVEAWWHLLCGLGYHDWMCTVTQHTVGDKTWLWFHICRRRGCEQTQVLQMPARIEVYAKMTAVLSNY